MSRSMQSSPRDLAECWQFDKNWNTHLLIQYSSAEVEDTSSVAAQALPSQEPSCPSDARSRDQPCNLASLRQTSDHSEHSPASLNHTSYTTPTESSPHGVRSSFVFSPGSCLIDQDSSPEWTQDVAPGSVNPLDNQVSYGNGLNTPDMQYAVSSDFHTYATPTGSSPHGVEPLFALSSGPAAVDQAAQWADDVAWAGSLMPIDPQVSPYNFGSDIGGMQPATITDFQPYTNLLADANEMMQMPPHAQVQSAAPNACQQCQERFDNKTTLDDHAKQTQHGTYACICGETFSRFDCLRRHLDKINPRELYPCLYCSKYSSSNGFHRHDKLTQHLRTFHKHGASEKGHDPQSSSPQNRHARRSIRSCPHDDCAYHSKASTAPFAGNLQPPIFRTQKELTKHIREVHNESPFPCKMLGCDRVGGKGYFRMKDLLKHQQRAGASHSDSPTQSERLTSP